MGASRLRRIGTNQDEHFTVILSGPINATVTDGTGIGTIHDSDTLPPISAADDYFRFGVNTIADLQASTYFLYNDTPTSANATQIIRFRCPNAGPKKYTPLM